MPVRFITPSSYVGPQVLKFREAKGWSQQKLAERLHELGTGSPGGFSPETGERLSSRGWSQTKVHKLESGKLMRVLVDDVFELALALEVSPLYLLTPLEGHDEQGNSFKVWLGGEIAAWPWVVRQWVRGVRPLLSRVDYRDEEAMRAGWRFYLLDSQPLAEWERIRKGFDEARRIAGSVTSLGGEETDG